MYIALFWALDELNAITLLQVATWSRHNAKVNLLLLFGEHILSVDAQGNMFIWAFKGIDHNLAPFGHIMLDDKFSPSCMVHPDTYLNKVDMSLLAKHKIKLPCKYLV